MNNDINAILQIDYLRKHRVHVVGFSGAEGVAALEFLWKHGVRSIVAHDYIKKEDLLKNFRIFHLSLPVSERKRKFDFIKSLPIQFHYRDSYLTDIERAEIIFASSGWFKHEANFPKLKQIHDTGVPFCTTIQLYLAYFKGTIVGVTGSNGKSTTAALIHHTLQKSGRKSFLAGNAREGQQVLDILDTIDQQKDVLVLEISDRQMLEELPKNPHISVITTISPNHLDDHGTFDKYIAVKQRLFTQQKSSDVAVLNYDNPHTRFFDQLSPSKSSFFSHYLPEETPHHEHWSFRDERSLFMREGQTVTEVMQWKDFHLQGNHNRSNAQAATLALCSLGCSQQTIQRGLLSFKGLPHRTEYVATYGSNILIDDLQSTTPESTIAALDTFRGKTPLCLIVGGDDKGMEYDMLADRIMKTVNLVIALPGTGTEKLCCALLERDYSSIEDFTSFEDALSFYSPIMEKFSLTLVSPACAGFQSHFLEGKSLRSWFDHYVKKDLC